LFDAATPQSGVGRVGEACAGSTLKQAKASKGTAAERKKKVERLIDGLLQHATRDGPS
jgi:hypothetical protein